MENSKLVRRLECFCSKVVRGFSVPVGLGVHWELIDWAALACPMPNQSIASLTPNLR